ncbi:MAG TPA: M56 family metallopeptidase [Tahibacter sp.]|uniref:M56 family metallopeptidase n=1 Tax=Tahibacter sp. TaxID=2056211 RepID=UPI002BC64BDE|nr:M56 family metallopeptidase [Tahibacter sp.]HSX59202.1 M56 family metallopeptidase [Tahibacter sp.]
MSDALGCLAGVTVALSVAVFVVGLVRPALRRYAGAEAAYALWSLPPVAALAALVPAGGETVQVVALRLAPSAATQLQTAAGTVAGWPAGPPIALWLAGIAVGLALQWRRQVRFRGALGRRRQGNVYEGAAGPCIAGLRKPAIVLPPQFRSRYDALERRLIVAHEIAHWRRGDLAANAFAALLRCVFWFNPLLHFAAARFRFDQELACDARVMRRFPEARRRYAGAMLKAQLDDAVSTEEIGASGWAWRGNHSLKERIQMLHNVQRNLSVRRRGYLLAGVLAAATAVVASAAQPVARSPAGFVDAAITLRSAGAARGARMINPFGRPFVVTTNAEGRQWRIEFVATPASAAAIRLGARVSLGERLVATPELLLPDGQGGEFVVDDLPGIPALGVDVRLQRRDTPTPPESGIVR